MDFYDYNIVSIGHSDLDEDWIIRYVSWIPDKYCEEKIRIKTMSLKEINEDYDVKYKKYKENWKLSFFPSLPKIRDLKFQFWHIFAFNPLDTVPTETDFHIRKYECIKRDCTVYGGSYIYTPEGARLDELEMVLEFTIPSVVKDIDLPIDHLQAILDITSKNDIELRESNPSIPFNGSKSRKYYLHEFIERCEKIKVIKTRSNQPEENPHISRKKKCK